MIKKIGLVILVAVLVLLGAAMLQPDTFRMQRAITIKAAPEKIIGLIDDFHAWSTWSPWEHLDPAMQRSYSGPARGKGAVYGWQGDSKVGAGRMEVLESSPPSKVVIKLDFLKPFESHNMTEFQVETKGDTSTVTWVMTGPSAFMTKLMGVFVSMDSMVGPDFEKGLAQMKQVAEKAP